MSQENGDFTPVEVAKLVQLENVCQRDQEVREYRGIVGGEDHLIRFPNLSFHPITPEEPHHHEIVFNKALLRGMLKIKRTLLRDISNNDPAKRMIASGLIEAYQKKP